MIPRLEPGAFVQFTYRPPPPPPRREYRRTVVPQKQPDGSVKQVAVTQAVKVAEPPSNQSKEAFVLHPNWNGMVHAIDLGRITPAEIQVLQAVMDPNVKQQVDAGVWPVQGVPNYPLIRDILRRQNPVELIKNPVAFYQMLVKPFLRGKDAYRKYNPQYMFALKVMAESHVKGQLSNPKPLFHK